MPNLSAEQIQYIIAGGLTLIAGAVGRRVLGALDRIPSAEWFNRVEQHMKRGHDHSNFIQAHDYRIANAEEALRKGRARMEKIDEHLEATDAQVVTHATRLAVLESK